MLFRELLQVGTKKLRTHACTEDDAAREASELLAFAAKMTRAELLASEDREASGAIQKKFAGFVTRRLAHEPLAWLFGSAWFHGREFEVNEATLIPRPATETIVEAAIAAAREDAADWAVDVGTGSGCIGVTLAAELPSLRVIATDLSIPAVATARRNATTHGVEERMLFKKTNLIGYASVPGHASIHPVPLPKDARTLIVANLPYLPTSMRKELPPCLLHEPDSALFSGRDGLDDSRALIAQVAKLPNKNVTLIFEILAEQFTALASDVQRAFPESTPTRIKNHQGVTVGLVACVSR